MSNPVIESMMIWENIRLLEIDVESFKKIGKDKIKKMADEIQKAVKAKDKGKLKKISALLPKKDLESIEALAKKKVPDFAKNYNIAKKQMAKKIKKKELVKPAAIITALKASIKKEQIDDTVPTTLIGLIADYGSFLAMIVGGFALGIHPIIVFVVAFIISTIIGYIIDYIIDNS